MVLSLKCLQKVHTQVDAVCKSVAIVSVMLPMMFVQVVGRSFISFLFYTLLAFVPKPLEGKKASMGTGKLYCMPITTAVQAA